MEEYRTLIIAVAVMLPLIVAFGWKSICKFFGFAKRHHLISIVHGSQGTMWYIPGDDGEDDMKYKHYDNYRDYVNDEYC